MTNKKIKLSEADKALFKETVSKVTPLKHKAKHHHRTEKNQLRKRTGDELSEPTTIELHGNDYLEPISSHAQLSYKVSGISERQMKKLKCGQLPIEASLDLHGLTIAEAGAITGRFLIESVKNELRVVKIIHGKGKAMLESTTKLKTQLNAWLSQQSIVLAFCSCQPKDGGTGAVLVLLRKNKE